MSDLVADEMTVILADPTDQQALRDLEVLSGVRVRPALAAQADGAWPLLRQQVLAAEPR